jgi:hypothetical protein
MRDIVHNIIAYHEKFFSRSAIIVEKTGRRVFLIAAVVITDTA